MQKFQIEKQVTALMEILIPKLEKFMEEKRNTPAIDKEVKKEVERIEAIEDILSNIPIEKYINKNENIYVNLDGYVFYYDSMTEMFKVQPYLKDSIENIAKHNVYKKNNLNITWEITNKITNRVYAIVSSLDNISFEDIRVIVESQIDFEEFFNKN